MTKLDLGNELDLKKIDVHKCGWRLMYFEGDNEITEMAAKLGVDREPLVPLMYSLLLVDLCLILVCLLYSFCS